MIGNYLHGYFPLQESKPCIPSHECRSSLCILHSNWEIDWIEISNIMVILDKLCSSLDLLYTERKILVSILLGDVMLRRQCFSNIYPEPRTEQLPLHVGCMPLCWPCTWKQLGVFNFTNSALAHNMFLTSLINQVTWRFFVFLVWC